MVEPEFSSLKNSKPSLHLFNEGISLSNHVLSKYYIEKLGLTDNISYMLNEHKDFNLNRNY